MAKSTVLLYGRTRAGKSTQIGVLAEHVYKTTKKKTRLYTADLGGTDTITPYIDLGIVEVVKMDDTDPWVFLNKAAKGHVRDATRKWVIDPKRNGEIGLYAFESMTAFADALMQSLAEKAASGTNIGGSANVNFTATGDGEVIKIGGSNMAHYNIVQTRITNEVWESQKLAADYVMWTASVSKDEDQTSTGKILGPQVVGKALTAEVPRWFQYTFRIDCTAAQGNKAEEHTLYMGNLLDTQAGNAVGLGNTRTPLDSAPFDLVVKPANIVTALDRIRSAQQSAKDIISKRLGL